MDGLEWKRTKYSKPVQQFLKFAERLAVKSSNYLISDSLGIQKYLKEKYEVASTYIPYGAKVFENPNEELLKEYDVTKGNYNMIMARFEPENNIETVLDGIVLCKENMTLLVLGNHNTKFGSYLKEKFKTKKEIRFIGAEFNMNKLNNLRYFSNIYFHGHSVGGTNPSLLEAMASKAFIVAHNNHFNKAILRENGYYFSNSQEVKNRLETTLTRLKMNLIGIK
jgi:hypothetical protein